MENAGLVDELVDRRKMGKMFFVVGLATVSLWVALKSSCNG